MDNIENKTMYYIKDWQMNKNNKSLEELINLHDSLIRKVVASYQIRGIDNCDLYQTGVEAFIKGINNFELSYGYKTFSTYIFKYINGYILIEIKKYLGYVNQIAFSLTDIVKETDSVTFEEVFSSPVNVEEEALNGINMYPNYFDCLTEKQKQVLELYYGLNNHKPLQDPEIAKYLGSSKQNINVMRNSALKSIRKNYTIRSIYN